VGVTVDESGKDQLAFRFDLLAASRLDTAAMVALTPGGIGAAPARVD